MDPHEKILEPLRLALKLEEEGRKFFREAAASVGSRFARRTFEFLAAEEDKHIERIKEFYRSIEQSGGSDSPNVDEDDAESRLAQFNDKLAGLKDEIRPTSTDIEAYHLALKFENGAEELYAKQLEHSDNPNVRKFYRWLMREEEMHARVIKSCLDFAHDPAKWFQGRKDS